MEQVSTPDSKHERWQEKYRQLVTEYEAMGLYVAGVIDGGSAITVVVGKDSKARLGYHITPTISLRRRNPAILQVIDEWATEHGIRGSIIEKNDSIEWKLQSRDDVREFLELLEPYLIVHDNTAQLILNEVLPRLDEGTHRTKDGFLETIEYADMVREATSGSTPKYNTEYFEELWSEELNSR